MQIIENVRLWCISIPRPAIIKHDATNELCLFALLQDILLVISACMTGHTDSTALLFVCHIWHRLVFIWHSYLWSCVSVESIGVLLCEADSNQQIPFHCTVWISQAKSNYMSRTISSLFTPFVAFWGIWKTERINRCNMEIVWTCDVVQLLWMRWTAAGSIHLIWLRANCHWSNNSQGITVTP